MCQDVMRRAEDMTELSNTVGGFDHEVRRTGEMGPGCAAQKESVDEAR